MTILERISSAYKAFMDVKGPPPPPEVLPEAEWVPEYIEEIESFMNPK